MQSLNLISTDDGDGGYFFQGIFERFQSGFACRNPLQVIMIIIQGI